LNIPLEHTPSPSNTPNKKNPFINLSEVARGMLCAGSLVLFLDSMPPVDYRVRFS
jgi:hypothetical protein